MENPTPLSPLFLKFLRDATVIEKRTSQMKRRERCRQLHHPEPKLTSFAPLRLWGCEGHHSSSSGQRRTQAKQLRSSDPSPRCYLSTSSYSPSELTAELSPSSADTRSGCQGDQPHPGWHAPRAGSQTSNGGENNPFP